MRHRLGLCAVLVFVGVLFGFGQSWADDEHSDHDTSEHHDPAEHHDTAETNGSDHHADPAEHHADEHPADTAEHHAEEHPADAEHHEAEHHEAHESEHHAAADEHHAAATTEVDELDDVTGQHPEVDPDADADEVAYLEYDADGDGKMEPDEIADAKELHTLEKGMPKDVDEAALEARPEGSELKPSIDVETFRRIVRLTKKFQMDRMEKKMAKSAARKMTMLTIAIVALSFAGVLLLLMPLVLRNKYPGQGKMLFKYSALAAVTFFVTVNLFGGVLLLMRTSQRALGEYTNPTLAICGGTFDTLDTNAEEYVTTGRELFVPTLEALKGNSDEQPAVLLLENGMRVVKDAKVFMSVAKMFKKISFIFEVIPIILLLVTMILFLVALKPTLVEIVKLPIMAARGAAVGRDVVRRSLRRVGTELIATLCTIGVLFVITIISAFVLGRVVSPAIDALLGYFSMAVNYLQFAEGASSGLVFLALFGVILFLVFSVASLIVSTIFFLGKSQKIFQARFTDGEPMSKHAQFWKWGIPSVLLVQLFPFLFVSLADKIIVTINESIMSGASTAADVSWTKMMLAGPIFLVIGYAAAFWAVRGTKAIGFLISYKVKPKAVRRAAGGEPAVPVPPQ